VVLPDSTTLVQPRSHHRARGPAPPAAVYSTRFFVAAGGLISYGVNWVYEFWLAASYVDRILRGRRGIPELGRGLVHEHFRQTSGTNRLRASPSRWSELFGCPSRSFMPEITPARA
jgi:hypothetical protein